MRFAKFECCLSGIIYDVSHVVRSGSREGRLTADIECQRNGGRVVTTKSATILILAHRGCYLISISIVMIPV